MSNYKGLLQKNWLQYDPVQQWYQSKGSKSWGKPVHKQTQMGLTKRYLKRETPQRTLPWNNQRKRLSPESKDMLRRKVKEIEAFNASKVRAAVKKKGDGKAITSKERRARCYICRKRGHVFWKCQNKGNTATPGNPTIENKTREPIMVEDEEEFKYPKDVHVKTNYMVEGTDFSNWNNIWYVSNAYKKHMSPTKSLFKRLKSRFRMEQAQHEKKFIFSHGIGEAVVETNENEIVIPCVLYTPEVTLNVLSLDQLLAQGFVITYGHDKCRISYMFGEDKKVYDGESDYGKGKGCDVKTESMIAKQNKYLEEYFDSIDPKDACPLIKGLEELKWNRNMVQDYLDDDYISVNGTLYAIKVNSFQRFISFLDLIKDDKLVYENWNILSKRFEDMLKWFYLVYLRRDVLEPLPPIIGRVKIDLLGLYKMVDSMGGYLSISLGNKWKDCYYETTLRAWYKEGLVKYEETKEVEIGCDHAKEGNPQEHVGSSKSGLRVVKDNTSGRFKNVQGVETHFGVILEGDNETDGDQATDQKDGGNTLENDDFVVIT
ncbi:ARID DNA-binding domain-containing protein [Tanacetum coccineum]